MKTLEERFWAKVDKSGECWIWTAATNQNGYGVLGGSRAHRLAYTLTRGEIADGLQVDHICHNRACVNPSHLRLATPAENSQNRKGATILSKSGHRGVNWKAGARKWRVAVTREGKTHLGGYFTNLDEAVSAAKELRVAVYGSRDAA